MIDFFFLSTWILLLFAIVYLYRVVNGGLLSVTILTVYAALGLMMSFLGYPIIYFGLDDYRVMIGMVEEKLVISAFLASAWSVFGVLLTFGALKFFARKSRCVEDKSIFSDNGSRRTDPYSGVGLRREELYWPWLLIFFLCVFVVFLYLGKVDSVALFVALQGGDVSVARSEMTNGFPGPYHWYSLFFYDLLWFVSLVLFAQFVIIRDQSRFWIWFFVFLVSCLSLLMTPQIP